MNEARLQVIEERIAWLNKHVAEQDRVMLAMGDEITQLKRQVVLLRERSQSGTTEGITIGGHDERPPHY